jgi:hypothetical protein
MRLRVGFGGADNIRFNVQREFGHVWFLSRIT